MDDKLGWLAAAVLAAAWAGELTARAWSRARRRRRHRRALRAERDAERLLVTRGYRIEERQATTAWTVRCDDTPVAVELRADLIVARGGRRFVAEVKTGLVAPRVESANTRRQLLEYAAAYDVDGVLLVDMETEAIQRVAFGLARAEPPVAWPALAAALAIGMLAGAALLAALP
jgi:hypothetical protein